MADKQPHIVPPVLEKSKHFQHPTIRSLWSQAGEALRRASRVFSLGYSLPVTNLTVRFLIQRCQPTQKVKWYVVDKEASLRAHFQDLLPGCYEIDTTFAGGPDCIPRLVAELTAGRLPPGM